VSSLGWVSMIRSTFRVVLSLREDEPPMCATRWLRVFPYFFSKIFSKSQSTGSVVICRTKTS
jgi:hypothetical protein